MSHTYSRTASLLEEFASSFESADQVILHKIYSSARENKKDFVKMLPTYNLVFHSLNKKNLQFQVGGIERRIK